MTFNYFQKPKTNTLPRLGKDLQEMLSESKEFGFVSPNSINDLWGWTGWVVGPEESPYEGHQFKIYFHFEEKYPFKAPIVKFATPIFHPNIDDVGRVCVDVLHEGIFILLPKMSLVTF